MAFEDGSKDTNERPPATAKSGGNGPSPALIGLAIAVALAVVFFFQNGEHTRIDFLFFERRTTIRFSIIVAVALGILVDRLFSILWRRRKRNNL